MFTANSAHCARQLQTMLALISLSPALACAATPFDGTWKVRLESMKYSGAPSQDEIVNGNFTCKTCVPAFTIKADGKQQPTPVHNTRDHMSVKVVSPRTVEYTQMVGSRITFSNTDTVSADGNTLNTSFKDYSGDKPYEGKATAKRVGPAPPGAHAVSGAWMTDSIPEVTEDARIFAIESTENGMKWTWNSIVTDAKFDGKQYPNKNDPNKTLVALKKVSARQFEERGTFEGKLQYVNVWTVSADGKSITQRSEDVPHGTKLSFVLDKQP
jgi:hypothetical protein